ncbi:MAG: EamA family transporter [bacterium]
MWILFALGASLFWGIGYVLNEQIYKRISVSTYLALASFAVFIVTLLISYFSSNLQNDIATISSSKKLLFYIISGIVLLICAELCIGFSIVTKNATLSGLVEISYPIFIGLFSYLLFKQEISNSTIIGGIIIFLGIFIIYYFNK